MARITPSTARNAIAVAKVVVPAVAPVVLPYVVQSAATLRERWDRRKARRLGVAVGELAQYTGRGGVLLARIAGIASSLADAEPAKDAKGAKKAGDMADVELRLRQLSAAVRAAERMPTGRRRAAHRSVSVELDAIEQRVLRSLGIQ